jgi:signal transduction histidine kinase
VTARVLVVDDQRIPRLAVGGVLAEAGYEVASADGGSEGIRLARSAHPDVIVLDVQMPDMDGFTVVERLKQDPRTRAIPVIFLTAEAPTEELIVRGLELGAYDFLGKGCSRAELLARVGVMARIKRNHDELAAVARVSDALMRTLDPAQLGRLFVEQIRDVFRADAALLVLASPEGAEVRAAVGLDPGGPAIRPFAAALLERLAAAEGGVDALPLESLAPDGNGGMPGLPFRSVVAVRVDPPSGRPLLLAGLAEREGSFARGTDAALLRLLATQAMNALDHAFLHARTRKQARKMEDQAERLERAMSERSRFFASISHELRTPINAVIGYSQLLEDEMYGPLAEPQAEAVRRVQRSARHLLELVNDVLDISKIEAGKLEIFPEPTDLTEVLHDTAASVHFQAEEKGLRLAVEAPATLRLDTDAARVRQIVLNLLANAVKFTEAGHVRVSAYPCDDAQWVEVRVEDTGAGIAPEDQQRIWEEFEQVEGATARGGTGLGLAISRRLAALLGGELQLQSEVGVGSVFTLRLPCASVASGG